MTLEFNPERSKTEQEQALTAMSTEVRIIANCLRETADHIEMLMEHCAMCSKEYRKD